MLKNVLCTAAVIIAMGSTVQADEMSMSQTFIGIEVGYAEVQGDVGHQNEFIENDYKGDGVEYGVRLGAQNDEWRTMFIFDYYDNTDDDQNVEKGYLTIDYFLVSEPRTTFKPYIGLNIGYANYESTYVDDSGFLYGVQGGFIVKAGDSVDLDLGIRYSFSQADAFDHTATVYFGFNYLF